MSNDYWEIANLIGRYAELLNLGEIDELAALFRYGKITSEGIAGANEGSEAVAGMYRNSVHFGDKVPDTLLFTSNLQLAVDGDSGFGKAYFAALHQTSDGVETVIAGRYRDEFRRIESEWWFHHRHMIPDLVGDLSSHLTQPLSEFQDEAT